MSIKLPLHEIDELDEIELSDDTLDDSDYIPNITDDELDEVRSDLGIGRISGRSFDYGYDEENTFGDY